MSFVVAEIEGISGTSRVRPPLAIASLRDLKRGGIMRDVDSVYSMGFNDVYVPIQKTSDLNPRFLVSNNERISRSTMMEYHQNQTVRDIHQVYFPLSLPLVFSSILIATAHIPILKANQEDSSYVPLLGEFFSETSTMIRSLWIPVTDPEDVDVIVHNMALSARKADCFCMVIPYSMVFSRDGKNDAITRYRSEVHLFSPPFFSHSRYVTSPGSRRKDDDDGYGRYG